ncbi:MAG: ribonuclease III [Gammaproteobacteria bacterium]
MTSAAGWIEKTLDYRFRDNERLSQALTHRSAGGPHNERLEFLGDAVLGMIIAETLFLRVPDAEEGYLTRLRANLVRRETLAEIGAEIGLGDWLRLGAGELKSGGFRRASILANGVEAVLGAIYLDSGLGAVRSVIERLYADRLQSLPADAELKDSKTRLQEILQSRGLDLPEYATESVSGEAHKRHFEVACRVEALGFRTTAGGRSRRQAEQRAAKAMIERIQNG